MNKQIVKKRKQTRTRARVNVVGTKQIPRLSVYRSLTSIYAQIIDDSERKTLVSASSKELKGKMKKVDTANEVGKLLAKKALDKGISTVVFDRGYFKYHGRVKALADGARDGGLKF